MIKMRTIEEIIKNRQSTSANIVENRKVIKSPHTGKERIVPGHIIDYVEHDATTRTEFNVDRYSDPHWHMRRERIKKREKRDRSFAAIEHQSRRRSVTDS